MIRKAISSLMVMLVLGVFFASTMFGADGVNSKSTSGVKEKMDFGKIPLYFIPNRGQQDEKVRYYSRTSRYTLWMTHKGMIFDCPGATERHVSRLSFLKSNPGPKMVPLNLTEHRHSIYRGNDPTKWHEKLPTSKAVMYKSIYPNIDLKVYGVETQLEYDWILKPGAKPNTIRFTYDGAKTRLDKEGNLIVDMESTKLLHQKPISYQVIDGQKVPVKSEFEQKGKETYGFKVGQYDKNHELIIDPMVAITYSTYLGGSDNDVGPFEEGGKGGIEVDISGCIYISGYTNSLNDFPTSGSCPNNTGIGYDIFVTKFSSDGSSLLYSVLIGGSGDDKGYDLAINANGNAYVTGYTVSSDFPAGRNSPGGNKDGIFFWLNADGCLQDSWYVGGTQDEEAYSIALDSSNNSYITGYTTSTDFPSTNSSNFAGGISDAFVCKLGQSTGIIAATYHGGSGNDTRDNGYGIAVNGNYVYVTGYTESIDFPIIDGYSEDNSGNRDAFVARHHCNYLSSWPQGTYLGGTGSDTATGIAVDSYGDIYITGKTNSTDFPICRAIQDQNNSGYDAFVTKLDCGSIQMNIIYSTYLGGTGNDCGWKIAVDDNKNVFLTGTTNSDNFPLQYSFQSLRSGEQDAFALKIDSNGTHIVYSTYLGGTNNELVNDIAIDNSSEPNSYIYGGTLSTNFPTHNSYQSTNSGLTDAFITRYSFSDSPPVLHVDKTGLNFAISNTGIATGSQGFSIRNIGGGSLDWTISENSAWISATYLDGLSSGRNYGLIVVSLTNVTSIPVGTHTIPITITAPGAINSPTTVYSIIKRFDSSYASEPPFGGFDTPSNNSTVFGSIPFSGWALDDIETTDVQLEFKKNENVVHVGEAIFTAKSRLDKAIEYSNYPINTRAGWGYLLQSYLLGNGIYTVHAKASDKEGNTVTLGTKTIYLAVSISPFGAICNPSSGGGVSSSAKCDGWALTPLPKSIQTVAVYIDGVYKKDAQYGGISYYCDDVSQKFPGYSDSAAPYFNFTFNSLDYNNGVHTMHCIVTDDNGDWANIGSNYIYFQIGNLGTINSFNTYKKNIVPSANSLRYYSTFELSGIVLDASHPISLKKGYNGNVLLKPAFPDRKGHFNVTLKELERVVISLNSPDRTPGTATSKIRTKIPGKDIPETNPDSMLTDVCGYIVAGDQLWPLPLGSTLDEKKGIFYWQTEAGHFGDYQLVFVGKRGPEDEKVKKIINVKVASKFNRF